ncbi:MAG: haloacid dehalogenase type II [Gemmatimonadales bacterium]|jgi:2-haloalkanoic acid dehalogenase type II
MPSQREREPERGALPELVTFDCYGTLIDWRSGIAEAFDEAVPGAAELPRGELFDAYARAEAEVESGPYQPYRQVLERAAGRAAALLGLQVPDSRRSFLADSLPSWRPFADTNPALERIASLGPRLGILSNIDDDLLKDTLKHLSIPFDLLITAAGLRSYKPAPAHFRAAIEACNGRPEAMVHVAESFYHDVRAARPLGIRTLWVNRTAASPLEDVAPSAELVDLVAAADWIEAL